MYSLTFPAWTASTGPPSTSRRRGNDDVEIHAGADEESLGVLAEKVGVPDFRGDIGVGQDSKRLILRTLSSRKALRFSPIFYTIDTLIWSKLQYHECHSSGLDFWF